MQKFQIIFSNVQPIVHSAVVPSTSVIYCRILTLDEKGLKIGMQMKNVKIVDIVDIVAWQVSIQFTALLSLP